jgi:parallel beta-helix repeat protein
MPMLITVCFFFCETTEVNARTRQVAAGPNLAFRTQALLDQAQPGDIIELPAGDYLMQQELAIDVDFVTLRGQGAKATRLRYNEQTGGPEGILVTADHVVIEDLAIIDHPGDGIKSIGVNGITVRRTHIEWTKQASPDNGAYGLYPVLSSNVLLEDNTVIGASDAGIYVGQSNNIIVRRNLVEYNVAGIEIENSIYADVYENEARYNTGGIIVFDLPNLISKGGESTRVFRNLIHRNNTENFSPEGNSVALVPQGSGMIIMANDDVEIFENTFTHHNTVSIAIVSYHVTESAIEDPRYDALPEKIYIHNNELKKAGRLPFKGGNELGLVAGLHALPFKVPHIVYDGIGQSDGHGGFADANLTGDRRICLNNNDWDGFERERFANYNLHKSSFFELLPGKVDRDYSQYECELPRLAPVELEPRPVLPTPEPRPDRELVRSVCEQGLATDEVNWDALAYDCPKLAHYNLFQFQDDPTRAPRQPGLKYTLSTPLYSDYAIKDRFVFIPEGQTAAYHQQAALEFPPGAVLVKSFGYENARGHLDVLETRLLIRRRDGWRALVYKWDDQQQEAAIQFGGSPISVELHSGSAAGTHFTYQIPHLQRCSGCHLHNQPIGTKAKWLNFEIDHQDEAVNQLALWQRLGLLDVTDNELATAPAMPVWNDPTTGSLDDRARAYLDINCAHCHNPSGAANSSGLFLNSEQPYGIQLGVCKPPIAAGRGSGGILFDIVPGQPEASILFSRLESTQVATKMPEIDKSIAHTEGLELVRSWIAQLPGDCKE